MRCPACGASNPEGAAWCGQCYRRFDEPEVAQEVAPKEIAPHSPESDPAQPGTPDDAAAPATAAGEGFRKDGDVIEWECPQCGNFNAIELQHCDVCGSSFLDRFRTEEPEEPRNWNAALVMTMLLPGAGHLAVGRYGSGWARIVLFAGWLLGTLMLISAGGSQGVVMGTPLLLGALILWVMSMVDVYRLQQGDSEILVGRHLLWLVVGVLLMLAVALFSTIGSVGQTPAAGPRQGVPYDESPPGAHLRQETS